MPLHDNSVLSCSNRSPGAPKDANSAQHLILLQASDRAATRASKQGEKGKAVAPALAGTASKGKAAAKRAAEPVNQTDKSPKKVAKRSSDEPPTPAKAPPAPAGSSKQPPADQRPGSQQNPST